MDGVDHHLPVEPTSSKTKSKRIYIKCDQCRHDRKKCEFTEGNPICRRCEELIHECSGPKRAEKKAGKKRKADEAEEDTDHLAGEDGKTKENASEATSVRDRVTSKRNTHYGRMSHGMAVNVTTQKLYTRTQRDLENSMTFERPSDPDLVTPTCKTSQELLNHINRRIKQLIACLMSGYDGLQPQRLPAESQQSVEGDAMSIDAESGEPIVLLCTENIPKPREPIGTQFSGRVHNTFKELPKEYYLHTEKAVSNLIASIPQDNSGEWVAHCQQHTCVSRQRGPFPAFVIAWLNLDFDTAYSLWLDTVKEGTVVDVLGRSFMHLVTESGDPRPLNKMPQNFLKHAEVDGRDLSLLDLAVIGNGSSIVNKIIEEGYMLPAFSKVTRATQRAILGNRPDIARTYLLSHLCWSDEFELNILAGLAYEKGFFDLGNEINQVVPYQPTLQDAQASLNVDLSFIDVLGSVSNPSSSLPYMEQPYQIPQTHPIPWNDPDIQATTQFQRSRNDPGGGGHIHLHDPRYPAS